MRFRMLSQLVLGCALAASVYGGRDDYFDPKPDPPVGNIKILATSNGQTKTQAGLNLKLGKLARESPGATSFRNGARLGAPMLSPPQQKNFLRDVAQSSSSSMKESSVATAAGGRGGGNPEGDLAERFWRAVEGLRVFQEQRKQQEAATHFLRSTQGTGNETASRNRSLQQTCPPFNDQNDYFGLNETLGEDAANWLQNEDEEDFVSLMIGLYVNEQIASDTGANIVKELSNGYKYSEVCARLPLSDDECYLVNSLNGSFLQALVAKFVPLGEYIVAAFEFVEEQITDIRMQLDEFTEFFLPDSEDPGLCFVTNDDMIGIAENPGFPPPFIYELCSCLLAATGQPPYCSVQPFFRGFALSTGANNALSFDVQDKLDAENLFYDGYVEFGFMPAGDLWASMDLVIAFPKLFGALTDYVCKPADGTSPTKIPLPTTRIQASIFVQNDLGMADGGGELLVFVAIEEVAVTLKFKSIPFAEVSLGSGFAALRVRSANPACQPSGLYGSVKLESDLGLGDGLKRFLNLPNPTVEVRFGVTWQDRETEDFDLGDIVQSLFLRVQYNDIQFMGISVETATIEIQYFDDKEFERRRDFNVGECCNLPTVSEPCGILESPIADFIMNDKVTPQPTIALFVGVENLSWYEIVKFEVVQLQFILQLPENPDDIALKFFIQAEVTVLFLLAVTLLVSFEAFGNEWKASFLADIEITAARMVLDASAEVTGFVYDPSDPAPTDGPSFLEGDWSLDVSIEFNDEWLEEVGEIILQGLQTVYNALSAAWDGIEMFATEVFDAAVALAKAIGGAIKKVFEAVSDALDDAEEAISVGLDAAIGAIDGEDLGPLGDAVGFILEGIGEVASEVLGAAKVVVEVGAAVLAGDWDTVEKAFAELGEDIASALGFSKKSKNKKQNTYDPLKFDENYNCQLYYDTWESCTTWKGIEIECQDKRGGDYPTRDCITAQTKRIKKVEMKTRFANSQAKCRDGSVDRSQGLVGVDDGTVSAVDLGTNVKSKEEKVTVGMASELGPEGSGSSCKSVGYDVSVKKLATGEKKTDGTGSVAGLSDACVNFQDKDSIEFDTYRQEVANKAARESRGNQGLDEDTTVSDCFDLTGATCEEPTLVEGNGFTNTAKITCDVDFKTLTWTSLFGEATLNVDPRCKASGDILFAPVFNIVDVTDPDDGCAPVTMTIERSGEDCCEQETEVFTHTLTIETLPPTFLSMPGSLNKEVLCDANIFPSMIGIPEYEPGCPGAEQQLKSTDSGAVFNADTCTTTIVRTFTLVDDDCENKKSTFEQVITLVDEYPPTFDSFPEDTSIGVFDDYGTDATGFPTAFQQCGASPVIITYSDEIEEGNCFAERVLTRTFRAEDICGKVFTRSQKITIANAKDSLPLGSKSLSRIYGVNFARVGNDNSACLFSSDKCSVFGAPTDYSCGSAPPDEFSDYQNSLVSLGVDNSLEEGPTEKTCECPLGDVQCDKSASTNPETGVIYGVQVVTSHGECETSETQSPGTNEGIVSIEKADCPEKNRGNGSGNGGGASPCSLKKLTGTNAVYNIFSIDASDLGLLSIDIGAPKTSIVLINVNSQVGDSVSIDKTLTRGTKLIGVGASNVLWNVANGVDISLVSSARSDYSFYGTLLNPQGDMKLLLSKIMENKWQGQLFCNSLNSNKINFVCGHFAGFASCDSVNP